MIARRFSWWLTLALATGTPVASRGQPTPPESPAIRWEVEPDGKTPGVLVVGLPPEVLKTLGDDPAWTPDRKARLFPVAIESGLAKSGVDRPGMLGTYDVQGDSLRFKPRYGFDRGRTYSATFRPGLLPGGSPRADLASVRQIPRLPRTQTHVLQVTPSVDVVPENLLKFYLHFNHPMSRGEVYDRVRLLKADGEAVDLPFLRLAEELWDPSGTRLTLLIDPGRIKRGLKPREENGPVLEAGRTYTLEIDPAWPDAGGDPLVRGFRKTFRAGPADETQPDPKLWKVDRPAGSTREPLSITFPEPIDGAMILDSLNVVDASGKVVDGSIAIGEGQDTWSFTPKVDWPDGDFQILVDADLEDLAGNSILRPFEVDIQRDTPIRPETRQVKIPIAIRSKGR